MGAKRLLIILGFLLFTAPAFAEDIYLAEAQAGNGLGANCANARAASFYNSAGNWGSGANKISAGDTVHLCGTIATALNTQGSGSSGSPITVLFETDAKISLPACSSANGCLRLSSRSWIIVDGGSNGIIESNDNGDALGNQLLSVGILADPCSNCEFKNLTIQNIFVASSLTSTVSQGGVNCILFSGSNVSIHDNVMHDGGYCVYNRWRNGDTNVEVYRNILYRVDHGLTIAYATASTTASGFFYHHNEVYDYANWDVSNGNRHHNAFHAFGPTTGTGGATDVHLYNNWFHGDVGAFPTSQIFFEQTWTSATRNGSAFVTNNVLSASRTVPYLLWLTGGTGSVVANNTLEFTPSLKSSSRCLVTGVVGGAGGRTTGVSVLNNAMENCSQFQTNGYTSFPAGQWDYNLYGTGQASSQFYWATAASGSFANNIGAYRTLCGGCDANSSKVASLLVDTATGVPQAGSPVAAAGTNLTALSVSLGIPELALDKNGNTRPSTGAWDIGAFNSSNPATPSPGNSGTITTSTVTIGGMRLSWTAANDNVTAQALLQYEVGQSEAAQPVGVAACELSTIIQAFTANIVLFDVTGLSPETDYHFCVVVKDGDGNKAAYTAVTQATASDTTAPTPGSSGTLTTASVTSSTLTLNWTAATDDVTAQALIQYGVGISTSSIAAGVAACEAAPIFQSYVANIITIPIVSLNPSTTYNLCVVAKDAAGNKAAYTVKSQATSAAPSTAIAPRLRLR